MKKPLRRDGAARPHRTRGRVYPAYDGCRVCVLRSAGGCDWRSGLVWPSHGVAAQAVRLSAAIPSETGRRRWWCVEGGVWLRAISLTPCSGITSPSERVTSPGNGNPHTQASLPPLCWEFRHVTDKGMQPMSQACWGWNGEHTVAPAAWSLLLASNRGTGRSEATQPSNLVLDGGKSNVESPRPLRPQGSGGQTPLCLSMHRVPAPAHASNPQMGKTASGVRRIGGAG